jgi:hypothetical protein
VRVLVERDFRQADLLQELERELGALLRVGADPWICIGSVTMCPTVKRGLSEA